MQVALKPSDFLDAAKEFEKTAPRPSDNSIPLLRMLKGNGEWVYGKDETEVIQDAEWVIDPHTLGQGYIAWHGGKIEGEKMSRIGQPVIDPSDLAPVQAKNGWEAQVGFGLVCKTGEDDGVAVVFKSNNRGGTEAFTKIFDAVKARAIAGKSYTPRVKLESSNYPHVEYGLIWKPHFTIVGWEAEAPEQEKIEEKPEQAEPEQAEPEQAEAPAPRRRRRRAA